MTVIEPEAMGLVHTINSQARLLFGDIFQGNKTLYAHGALQTPTNWTRGFLATQFLILFLTLGIFIVVRRRFFSGISSIPGPFLASVSRFWHLQQIWNGDQQVAIAKQHEKHGMSI
jgi:hypothetical protein